MKVTLLFFVSLLMFGSLYSQDTGSVLMLVNADSDILIDGEVVGEVKSMIPGKFEVEVGKHYIQALNNELNLNKGKFIDIQSGKQEVYEISFDVETEMQPIDICNQKVTTPGVAEVGVWLSENPDMPYPNYPTYLIAFEKGDIMVINCSLLNGKGTNVINIYTYPDNALFYSTSSFRELNNIRLKIDQRQIYKFEIITNHILARDCNLHIARIPESESTAEFSTLVTWQDVYTPITVVKTQKNYINSGSNATFNGGKSRVSIPVSLPDNTVKWYYKISASRDEELIRQADDFVDLASEIASLLDISSGLLTFGINQFTKPPGSDYCDIYLLDHSNSSLFEAKENYSYISQGSRENIESGIIDIDCCNTGQYYLGIKNPDGYNGVNTVVEVVAVVKESGYKRVE